MGSTTPARHGGAGADGGGATSLEGGGPVADRLFYLRPSEQGLHPVGRLELFGDAVLAIAGTLLVLTLTVPAVVGRGGLPHVLWVQRFTFVAILIGFFEIGGSWFMSRRLARLVARVDHWVTVLWMGAVFTATLIPFTTLLLARSFSRDDFNVGVFSVSVVTWLALMLSTAAVLYVRRAGLLRPEAGRVYAPYLRIVLVADVVWTITVPLSLVLPWAAFCVLVVGYATGLCPLPTESRLAVSDPGLVLDD